MYRNNTNARSSGWGSGTNSPQEGGARMKTRIWALGLMVALFVGATAMPAAAIDFSYTFDGCAGDSVCLTPVLSATPDSIVWELCGAPPFVVIVDPGPAPFDTCFQFNGYSWAADGRADSICMHAWYAAVDSVVYKRIDADKMEAVDDGRNCDENDSVLVNVLANDTSFLADIDTIIVPWNAGANGPFHGTAYLAPNNMVWYKPTPGYNGTDIFAYYVENVCGQSDTAVVAITILSDGLISIDSCWYDVGHIACNSACGSDCDEATNGTINIGDSLRVCVQLSPWDLDELTAGWPRVDLPGLAGTNLTMIKDTSNTLGMFDSTVFCWPGRTFDSANTWFIVSEGNLDIVQNFYKIVTRARSSVSPFQIAACTTIVNEAIDNNDPDLGAGEASWTLWKDVDGDGIATTEDTMRFFIDLRNEPFEEICEVYVTVYGFPTSADTGILANTYCLHEIAGDNRWARILPVPPGDLENFDGPYTAVFHYKDNACNEDSVSRQYAGQVDNTSPDCACIQWEYYALNDLDENGCFGLGETVRIRVRDTCNSDVAAYYVDLMSDTLWRLGLGVDDEADSSHHRFQLPSVGGGWYGVDWVLGKYPLANAIDTIATMHTVPWVFLHAEDDAGNQLTCDSLALVWTGTGASLDARAPEPVTILGCFEDTTFIGTRAVRIRFTDVDPDVARFRMFYDDGTGVIDYVDTLAGLNWADTVGGGGTDGLIRVNATTWDWTTDGTVELSWCRDYLFNIWVIDDCGNLECMHPDSVLCMGERPDPVAWLDCSAEDDLNICLEWQTNDASVDSFCIFMASDGAYDTAVWVATVQFSGDIADTFFWCTDDAGLDLIEYRWYDFIVLSYDSCGNVQDAYPVEGEGVPPYVAQCFPDLAPPVVCIFQPASLTPGEDTTVYSCDHCSPFIPGGPSDGMYIYTRPCNDTSLDVQSIDSVLVRIADSAGAPSDWYYAGFTSWQGPNHWVIRIDCQFLDGLVRTDDSVEVLQVMVISTDAAGRTSTRDQVETCCGFFEFVWSAYYVDVYVKTVNDKVQTYQIYCNAHGFDVSEGPIQNVEICIEAGTPPFKIRMSAAPSGDQWADEYYHQVVYVENVFARCTTLTFSTQGWNKGLGELDVEVCDVAGHYSDETEIALCVKDTIPPCALITNPVDGKCIRRSRSMIDPVQICMTIDPAGIGLDNENILKVDFQWAQDCCVGFVVDTVCFDTACPPPAGFPEGSICTTFANPNNPFFGQTRCYPTAGNPVACTVYAASNNLDSTICWTAQADTSCTITVCRLREVPCETVFEWETFAIVPGQQIGNDYCVDWWNTEDLAWITESGTIIYLRAIVYDEQGNQCISPCVQVCVDIDTPPLCLWTPDVCPSNGYMALGGNEDGDVTFVAELDLTQGNIDDLEDVTLWYKKSTDPDLFGYWYSVGSGFFGNYASPGGTNSTVWRWDLNLYNLGLQDGISYDWRVQAHTIWGTHSYDNNGDGAFDHNTFDSSACDMGTYYIDLSAPQVAMDTVWTEVNGQLIVQPNVSCALSDPRGWAWTQFGNSLTVQPSVYPWTGQGPEYLNFKDDVKRVRWTLWDDSHDCECEDTRGDQPFPSMSCFDEDCDCYNKGGNGYCDGYGDEKGVNGNDRWVIADRQGANPMANLTFNPADAPWWDDQWTGVQQAVLLVEVWDSCGNRTQDCITLYLLDADPTDAIIVEPMNDQVFCTAPGADHFGGIEIRSASILEEGWNKAVYAYRPVGSSQWIEFDSVGVPQDYDRTWQTFWNTVVWNPVAMGLPDGSYELTVWAVDNALNRSENLYIVTVHLSCAAPTVALVYPTSTDPAFIGCPIELEAIATTDDPRNPIVQVDFYYVRVIDDLGESNYIGSDYFTVDGRWGYHWKDPDIEGPHYIYAIAENLAGQTAMSELVWVKGDNTEPYGAIMQVGDDLSIGNPADPTIIQAGEIVPIWGWAVDNDADWGYGEVDNCGVDSVVISIYSGPGAGTRVAGFLMQPSNTIDSVYTAMWNTAELPPGIYSVRLEVYDCACNGGDGDYGTPWRVRIVGPDQDVAISADGPEICGYVSADDYLDVTATFSDPDYVGDVYVAYSNMKHSDINERYEWEYLSPNGDGTFSGSIYTGELEEGLYRLRVVWYNAPAVGGGPPQDPGGQFGDFTFDESLPDHMIFRVDHSLTPMSIVPVGGTTFRAHDDICFVVEAEEECDIDHLHICAGDDTQAPGSDEAENPLAFCFDPVDSSCVTLSNCGVWSGELTFRVSDALGHTEIIGSEVWILDVAGPDTALIVSPSFGSFVTPTSNNTLMARKLSSSGVDSVQFWRNTTQGGNGSVYIGSAAADGDVFTYEWDVTNVAEGNYFLFTRSFNNNVGKDGPRCVNITVAKGCAPFAMMAPNPSYQRTVNGQTITFVGDRVDLCIDRSQITSITNGVGIDSVVWFFRAADAPGVFPNDNENPFNGWVRIASDRFGSLCIDWWTDWCSFSDYYGDDYYDWLEDEGYNDEHPSECCPDGRFTVVAYVYDKAGNTCHSVPQVVTIDNTAPYSEIVDIDGDETFGDCHVISLPGDSVIKVTANAIDMTCLEGALPAQAWSSGAKYLQFFAGGCGTGGSSPVDILFVVDGSNSMRYNYFSGNNLNTLAAAAGTFTNGFIGRNVQYGVIGFSGEVPHDCEANLAGQVIDRDGNPTSLCDGIWTTSTGDLTNMLFGVGSISLGSIGGQTDNNYEFGLQAIANGLQWYDWRAGAERVIVLITDEDDDPTVLGFPNIPLSNIEQSGASVYTVLNLTATTGYATLASNTGGQVYDWNANLGATMSALASAISVGANFTQGDVGVVWGKQVTLTDGQDNAFALWNVTGLEPGEYCVWTKVIDQIGNVYESRRVSVCIEDHTPPTMYIAGFGKSTDEHMKNEYAIYGQSWDTDIEYVQFQYRPVGGSATDWTGVGIPIAVGCNGDNTLWMTKWNPCVLSGTFQMRVVPTDHNGNQDHAIQPIATVTIANCEITPAAASSSASAMYFEDRTFADLGLVHLDMDATADNYHNSMIAVWADLKGDLESECINLYAPDPDQPAWLSGSFDAIQSIKLGGEGWFWQAYTDNNNVTHLKREVVTVWPIRAAIGGCNSTHPTLGAKVCVEPGALPADNGIIVFPARVPVVNWSQQHYQAWPAQISPRGIPLVSAIRLTSPINDDYDDDYYDSDYNAFNLGKYAKVTIKYRDQAQLDNRNLTVGWWDGDQWNIEDGMLPASAIDDTSGAVYTTNLHGLYSIVSAGRTCIPGAVTVENAGMEKAVGNITGPWPTIFTRVRSNIEFNNGNRDIPKDGIVVVLDGHTTLYANGESADRYDVDYDHTSGILTVNWIGPGECLTDDEYDSYNYDQGGDSYDGLYAPALTAGTHTLYVQAFNEAGYCSENTFTFTVDRTSPDVTVTGYEDCANPTFHIKITDDGGAGVDWENVFIDVFDVTGSEFSQVPKSRLIHTETYEAFDQDLNMATGEFSFQIVSHIAQGRRLRIVIYIGDRYDYFDGTCNCEYTSYDHDCDGVQDRVGNRTQIVEEQYTIWGSSCSGGGGGDGSGDVTIQAGNGSGNPFDPWAGGSITFNLNGFDGGGSVSVGVYDVAGVKVADLSPGNITSTVGTVVWNGRNQDGEYVAQGVYLVHFSSTGGQAAGPSSQVLKVVVKRGSTAGN